MATTLSRMRNVSHMQCRNAAPQRVSISCSLGGPGDILRGSGGNNANQGKLIIPGKPGGGPPPRPGSPLIIPGGSSGPGGSPSLHTTSDGVPVMRNFRPPPGFMDAGGAQEAEPATNPSVMLDRIQAGAGHWHQLAKLLPALQRAGYDAGAVEECTGIERKQQHLWSAAAQIYDSLANSGQVGAAVLAHYDQPGAEHLLYELRFLSLQQRLATADYMARQGLDAHQALVLARAVKEHERRDGLKEGFSASPADCLAYKHYRDAHECRLLEDADQCVQRGLAVAETEEARTKLTKLLKSEEAVGPALPAASLTVLRLTRDEVGCRPVPVAGTYCSARAEAVRSAPKVSSEGVFGNFTIPAEGVSVQWVPLPAWAILSLAGRPVALTIANCGDVPAMRLSSAVKTENEAKKLKGEGLLVVDASPGDASVAPGQYYAVAAADGTVDIMDGTATASSGAEVLGPVLFVCRPPSRETAASTTSELLSL